MPPTRKTSSPSQQKIKEEDPPSPSLQTRELRRRHIPTTPQKREVDDDDSDTSLQYPDSDSPPPPISSTRKSLSTPKQEVESDDEEASPPQSRGNTPLRRGEACHVCRHKRKKCNGAKPTCIYCTKHNYECEYDDPETFGKQRQLRFQIEQTKAQVAAAKRELVVLRQALGMTPNNPGPANPPISQLSQRFSRLTLGDSSTSLAQQRTRGAGSRPSTHQGPVSPILEYYDSSSPDDAGSYSGGSSQSPPPSASTSQAWRK